MDCPEIDERIYLLHATFGHTGAFVNCRQCRTVIGIVDDAVELAQATALPDRQGHYDTEPMHGRTDDPSPTYRDASLDALASAVLSAPPKTEWRYMKRPADDDAPWRARTAEGAYDYNSRKKRVD